MYKYKQGCEFKLSDSYLSFLFTGVSNLDQPVSVGEDIPHIFDDFEYERDVSEYTPTNENVVVKELPSSSQNNLLYWMRGWNHCAYE